MTELPEGDVGSAGWLRRLNAGKVLNAMWFRESATANDLISATGLTRATVLAQCKELTSQGWLRDVENARQNGSSGKGRPALRYAFNPRHQLVMGIDAGQHRISASVADLCGTELGSASRTFQETWQAGVDRRQEILRVVDQAMSAADVGDADISFAAIGVPAPVNDEGRSPQGLNDYWDAMNPDLVHLLDEHGWACVVDNDANLAATAELYLDPGARSGSFAALLAGERYGAGLVFDGEVLRQRRGGAGELRVLNLVEGVGDTHAIGTGARRLAGEAIEVAARGNSGEATGLSRWTPSTVRAENVFREADAGDAVAQRIVARLLDQLARVCVVLAGPLDLDRIVISGGTAHALRGRLDEVKERVGAFMYAPWLEITASTAGADAVRLGAVYRAIQEARDGALTG